MKVSLKKVKDCKIQMSVEVEADTVETRFQEVLRTFQRQARLPGFREGKAPADLIEKRFAEEAREEMLKSLIPEVYHQTLHAQKVSAVSLPKISGVQYVRGKKLSFSAEFEEAPSVSIKNFKGIKLKRESAEVTADDLEKGLESLLDSKAELVSVTEVRPVQAGDVVSVDIELWLEVDAKYIAGQNDALLSVEKGGDDDFFEKIVGATVGGSHEITRAGKPFTRLHLKEIRQKLRPELNEEFAKLFGRDTVEDLREALRKDIAAYKHSQSLEKMKSELFGKLLGMASFPSPESLVEKQKERLISDARQRYQQMGAGPADLEKETARIEAEAETRAKEQIRLYFILQKIAELEKIDTDELELTQKLQAMAVQSKRPIEEVRRVFEDDLRESMREKKTVDFLIANAKFEEDKATLKNH